MAADVDAALVSVIAKHAKLSQTDAESKLKDLRRSGRYQRDVY
jgi:sulfite reductase alpha subunit-like flavoprotein